MLSVFSSKNDLPGVGNFHWMCLCHSKYAIAISLSLPLSAKKMRNPPIRNLKIETQTAILLVSEALDNLYVVGTS